jgi:hypothetical protein
MLRQLMQERPAELAVCKRISSNGKSISQHPGPTWKARLMALRWLLANCWLDSR